MPIWYICSFIVSFLNNSPDAERDSAAVQEFLANMEAAFRAHSLWAGSSEEELESAGEVSIISYHKTTRLLFILLNTTAFSIISYIKVHIHYIQS